MSMDRLVYCTMRWVERGKGSEGGRVGERGETRLWRGTCGIWKRERGWGATGKEASVKLVRWVREGVEWPRWWSRCRGRGGGRVRKGDGGKGKGSGEAGGEVGQRNNIREYFGWQQEREGDLGEEGRTSKRRKIWKLDKGDVWRNSRQGDGQVRGRDRQIDEGEEFTDVCKVKNCSKFYLSQTVIKHYMYFQ